MTTGNRLDALPVPRFAIGERVYCTATRQANEEISCPDCLGTGKWAYESPAGLKGETNCPRCAGKRTLSIPTWVAAPEERTVGSIEAKTIADNWGGSPNYVRYMCNETGIGSGTCYTEADLHKTLDGAKLASEQRALLQRAQADNQEQEHGRERARFRELSKHQITAAAVKEVEHREFEARWALSKLVEQINELSADCSLHRDNAKHYDTPLDYATLKLEGAAVTLLQEHLVSYNDLARKLLLELRANKDECKC